VPSADGVGLRRCGADGQYGVEVMDAVSIYETPRLERRMLEASLLRLLDDLGR
jgi:hypothetical protein